MTAQTIVGPLLLTSVVFALGWWGWAALAAVVLGAGLLVRALIADRSPLPAPRQQDLALSRSG